MKIVFFYLLFWFPNQDEAIRKAYLKEVNAIRAEGCTCGGEYFSPAQPVTWDETLEKTAYLHSKDMQSKKYFAHISKSGKTPADRLKAQGYIYKSFAENIFTAQGYIPSPQEVVMAWKKSPSHCKNIMNNTVSEMGVGVFNGYYTQLFGTRKTN